MAARRAPARRDLGTVEGWSDPAFARVAEVVHLVSGLVFPTNRQRSAEAGMRRAMSSLRLDGPDALREAVRTPGQARDALLAELTVGETYFFRESGQLEVIRTELLARRRAATSAQRPLRIWSAGCASGEEPYTLAILMREEGWPYPVELLATDVALPRLAAARRATYTKWSLRGVSEERIARWFERRGSLFQLDDSIRTTVDFRVLNLIADDYPSASTATAEQDIVLCRNVLIYFDMKAVERIARSLLASLALDGWLLLGASDPPLAGLVPCEVVLTPGGVAYRRADRDPERATRVSVPSLAAAEPRSAAETDVGWTTTGATSTPTRPRDVAASVVATDTVPARADLSSSADEAAAVAYARADYARVETLARATVQRDDGDSATWVLLVRAVANQGRLRDADELCVRGLDRHRLSPELHSLHATLLAAAGQHRESANAARRALYLDRRFVMAHLQLGDALARLGEVERSRRSFASVMEALAGASDDAPIVGADGVSASRLRQVAALRLGGLADDVTP